MEITEAHIEIAKREYRKSKSVPAVAGTLMKRTPDADFQDLIAIANRAKMELQSEEDSNDDADHSVSAATDESTDTGESDEQSDPIPAGGVSADTQPDETESKDTGSDTPPSFDEIDGASDNNGEDAWSK